MNLKVPSATIPHIRIRRDIIAPFKIRLPTRPNPEPSDLPILHDAPITSPGTVVHADDASELEVEPSDSEGELDALVATAEKGEQLLPQLAVVTEEGNVRQDGRVKIRLTLRKKPMGDGSSGSIESARARNSASESDASGEGSDAGDEDDDEGEDDEFDEDGSDDGGYDENDEDLVDEEDAPDWNFAPDEKLTDTPEYTFCPSAHRGQLLRILTKHFCRHPLFPTRSRETQSAPEIRRACVQEMYQFCHGRNLREVWAYLWTQWYSPAMWPLWARSASPYLSRLRTTMTAENHWKQIKHQFLHHLNRPRLDLTIYILCTEAAPEYLRRAREHCRGVLDLGGDHPPLTSFQKALKRAWKLLSTRPINNPDKYTTSVATWSCSCGSQELQAQHLCKHLVQAVNRALPPFFFHELVRRRTAPFYRHPHIHPTFSSIIPEEGSISDGDDRPTWFGDHDIFLDGKWEAFSWAKESLKRKASVISSASSEGGDSKPINISDDDSDLDEVRVCSRLIFSPVDCLCLLLPLVRQR